MYLTFGHVLRGFKKKKKKKKEKIKKQFDTQIDLSY